MSQQSQEHRSEHAVEEELQNPEPSQTRSPQPGSSEAATSIYSTHAPTPRYYSDGGMVHSIPNRRSPSKRLQEEFRTLYPNIRSARGREFQQWSYDISAPAHDESERRRYRTEQVEQPARHGAAARGEDYVWSSHEQTPTGYESMTFPDTRRTYYYSRPGLPPPTEETPGFWNRPVDMRRAYQHLQADYDRLHNTVIQLTKEVRAEREARLATDNAHKQLLGKLVEERRLKEEALKEALGRENELAAAQQMRQRLQVVDQNEANYKAYIQDLETRLSAEKRESELWRLRSIEHRQTIQKLQAKQTALSRVPPPPPTRTQEVRTPVPLESLYEDIITPVARGLQSQPPTSRTRTRPHFEAKKGNQTSILNWAERVEGPSTVNRVRQSNTVQPGGRVATPPISPAHSVYLGDDQDDEFKDLHYAFPPEQEVPAPDRNRRSMAPQPASSDELHRQSFRGPKVNLPEPFDGTKAKARTWFTDIMNYIVMKSSEFGDEQAKIRWAISYIRGEHVNHWKTSLFERMDGGEVVYFTLQDFAKDFKRMYYLANPELEGQRMLRSMQQRFKPWEEFITEWEHWVKVSGYKDEQLLLQLLRAAMRKELCDRVWASEGISQDVNSYQLWIQVAARLDLQQQQQWAATFEDRKGKGKKSDSKARQVGIGKGSATAPETANAVRTARSPVKNVDEAGRSVPHKDIVGVENERDKLRKCGACGKLRNEGGSCTDIWHTHYYDTKAQCWRKKDQPAQAARAVTVEETEAVRAFKVAIAANPALLGSAGFQFGKA